MPRVARAPIYFAVPPDAPHRKCAKCPAEIYMVRTPRGARMPVCCDVDGGQRPDPGAPLLGEEPLPGRGLPHWIDCPARDEFRRPR